jgi:phosphoglucosamine mutase
MKQHQKTLAQLLEKVTLFPQTLINVKYKQGYDWKTDAKIQEAIKLAEKNLSGSGRVLIRPSGTEPLLRVMVEAQDTLQAQEQAKKIAQTIPL